jgi:DNA-binding NtrC family response regulator
MTGNLLLVEDEEGLRIAIATMLRKKGLKVIEAGDGWAAMDMIRHREQEIDLILLDMTIPGASSHEVVGEVQRIRPEASIILTTAYGRETAGSFFDAPQMKGFIRKPYRFAELMDLLSRTLEPKPQT